MMQPKPVHPIPNTNPTTNVEEKKFNIVMYGIKESPPKTSKSDHLENNLQSINNEFTKVELPIQASSVKDCFRLGKYKSNASCPRPILIKFLRSTEASLALSKIASFQSPVHIKPDLTPKERQAEKVLLKERWTLMQLGFDKERNKCIFIYNNLYGQYQNSELRHSDYNPPLPAKPPTTQSFSNGASEPDQ